MLEGLLLEVAIIVILLLANGFFAASEIAVVSARKSRLEHQALAGHRGAAAALELAGQPNRFLSAVQVGITLIGTFAAAFGGASIASALEAVLASAPALAPYAGSIALGMVVLGITYFSLIIGELVPKRLALQNAEAVACAAAPIMRAIARLGGPIISLLTISTELVLRLIGRHKVAESPITEEDIMALVREGTAGGAVESAEQDLIGSVFTFTDRKVRSLMTPRTQMLAIDIHTPSSAALQMIADSNHSRLPVYEDAPDRIIGILHAKDLLRAQGRDGDLRPLLRPPLYLLESQRAVAALQQLRQHGGTLALVLDEYGQVSGLITITDLIEGLVGDLGDEGAAADEPIVRREDGSYLVDGLLPVVELRELLQLPRIDELAHAHSFETSAGLLLTLLGRIPGAGDAARWQGYTFEVVDMDELRIDKILITPPRRPAPSTNPHIGRRADLCYTKANTAAQRQ
jgi:putative hemolysin